MASKLKPGLQSVADWVTTISKAAGDTVDFAIESGYLQDTLDEICSRAGVAGAVFKLGAMAIPDGVLESDAETRIGVRLTRKFVEVLDKQLFRADEQKFITKSNWKSYQNTRLEEAARQALDTEFTWLKVVGIRGRKSSRSWPVVHELADLARAAIWETATFENPESINDIRRFADDVRGIVHEELAGEVDKLVSEPTIESAMRIELPKVVRDSLKLLAERFVMLDSIHLFDEIPQNKLFIPPTVRIADFGERDVETDWNKIPPIESGHDEILKRIDRDAGSPRVIVIVGEMGVGKSCLMRVLASRLAEKFVQNKKRAVLFANWRDIYEGGDLTHSIAEHIDHQYGLPLPEFAQQGDRTLKSGDFNGLR